ncbi:tetratricopeptide repeat protein [Streptomyces rubellomurinus]|uniref:Tetratricopeptide repeat protein n=2 Tax=Streptomyces TaxID=1883 RepID=A0A0F2T983_STRR3|nr:tetratricopeptide repeat protein [Streptomyces rubellomurinus]KJS57177.1 tetratricopeptide repeat protein [Streptomyces rubellomurinus subsp. indigoferus]KJS59773.1 tetratricopeptide repeat protein [Streptomyces rubellomurinus]
MAVHDEYRRAAFYFDSKAYADAARLFEGVLAEEPANLSVRLMLARSYYHSAQLGRAEAELHRILEADPAEDYARLMLGRTLERQGRAEEARPHLRLAAAMTGEDV